MLIHIKTKYSNKKRKGEKRMAWTQNELEELYQKVNKLAAEDADFRKELQADSRAAIEKIAGKELPEGFRLKFIENDPSYNATYVVPDITSGELNLKELQSVSGGSGDESQAVESVPHKPGEPEPEANFSILFIVSACAAAIQIAGCGADACAAAACPVDACAAQACAARACAGQAGCAAEACGGEGCGAQAGCMGNACAADVCAAHGACAANACAADGCVAHGGCLYNACAADGCAAQAACIGNLCGGDACAAYAICTANVCPGDVCGAHGVCAANICPADFCGAFGGCAAETCGAEACSMHAESGEGE